MEKVMMMITCDDYPLTKKIPSDYEDIVNGDDDKKK